MSRTNSKSNIIFILSLVLATFIFIIDVTTDYHIVEGNCYPPILLFTILTHKKKYTITLAIIFIIFTVFEFFYTGDILFTDETGIRFISIIAMIITTYLIVKYRNFESMISKQKENLEKLNSKLKESNTELENFAFISSHDLQEPLRKIQAFGDRLNSLEANNISENGKEYLTRMINAASRMQVLINDLLYFSRQTNAITIYSKVDLNIIMKEVISDLEMRIESSNAQIIVDKLPSIEAGPIQMRQLKQNLISNSIKFAKENESPVIKIYSKTVQNKINPEKQMVELYFEDNGIGFDEKFNDRIYNIFQKLEGNKYRGSGIGLSICKKIVERHNGTIYAKSIKDKGTTFVVTLPIKQDNSNE